MSKTIHPKNSFNAGEISPRSLGRFDLEQYNNAVKTLENFFIYQLGGISYRPGTVFVNEVKDSTKSVRLIPFEYSTSQTYIIEMGNLYMRFYANGGRLESPPGTPVEVVTPYTTADLFQVQYCQSADTMYLVHPLYPIQKLTRTSSTSFSLVPAVLVRGPFLDKNITTTTITPSASTGTITLTASTSIFQAGHVGSYWQINSGATTGAVVKITVYTSGTVVTGVVQAEPDGTAGAIGGTSAYTAWWEGAFSTVRGYPSCVAFHQQRLIYANTLYKPQTFWASQQGAYDNFLVNYTVLATDAYNFTIANNAVNAIRWVSSGPNAIEIGTTGGTFSNASTTTTVITPTNVNVNPDTSYGAANIMPVRCSSFLYYIQRNLNQVRELTYDYLTNREKGNDMNLLSDHILRDIQHHDDLTGAAVDIDRQQSPNDRIWIVRNDGQMCVLTRNAEQQVVGWSRFIAGRTKYGGGLFESVAILPQDANDDQTWVVVNRNINGTWKRYIEYFSPEYFQTYYTPIRLDASLTYDSFVSVTGATNANPVVVTAVSHGFSNGDYVKIDNVLGMDDLNTNVYVVANKTLNTFQLNNQDGTTIDGTGFGVYLSGGEVRKMVTTVSGLSHLEGETVSVTVDGGLPSGQQTFTVTGGSITLLHKAAVITVGLPYTGKVGFLMLNEDSKSTGQSKNRRLYMATFRLYQSLGMKFGQTEDKVNRVYFSKTSDQMGHPPSLFTGDYEVKNFDAWWSKVIEPVLIQDQPLPLMILSVILRSEVEEKN